MRRTPQARRWTTALAAFVVVCLRVAGGFAQAPTMVTEQLSVAADRPEGLYRRGETVTFTITASRDGKLVDDAEVKYQLTNDGFLPPHDEGKLTFKNGKATVTGKLDVPGFLLCRVNSTKPNATLKFESAAAAVDPLEIKPSLPVPDDFDAFWNEQKSLLSAIPLNVRLTPVASPLAGVECFDLQADGWNGPLSGYLAMPKGAIPGTLPAIIVPHGAGVRGSVLLTAAKWAHTGFLALDFNANGLPNGKSDQFYADLAAGELRLYYLKGRESRETSFFRTLFLRVVRACDAVTSQKEWNGRTLVVHGISQGGGQAIAAAALDPRVTFFCALVPAICDHSGSRADRVNGWPNLVPSDKQTNQPDENVLQAARYFDGVNLASRAKAPALFTVGFVDFRCAPTSVYAAYNAVPGQKQIVPMPLAGHTTTPEADVVVRGAVLKHAQLALPKN